MQNRHIPQRASRTAIYATAPQPTQQADNEYDDDYSPSTPRSALRYSTTQPYTIQQGNRRLVFHAEPPPRRFSAHWLFFVGVGMLVSIALWVGLQMLGAWWSQHQLDATYGTPRTYQVDAVVGHADSSDHPTHFIVLNLKGRVVIIELPGGNVARARIYNGPLIVGDNPAQIPATADFQDVNGDGKIDLIVHIGNQQFTYINDGTEFKPQQ